jgi:hypothetical protein
MGRTACTEFQCLYKGALYLFYHLYLGLPSDSFLQIFGLNFVRLSVAHKSVG